MLIVCPGLFLPHFGVICGQLLRVTQSTTFLEIILHQTEREKVFCSHKIYLYDSVVQFARMACFR